MDRESKYPQSYNVYDCGYLLSMSIDAGDILYNRRNRVYVSESLFSIILLLLITNLVMMHSYNTNSVRIYVDAINAISLHINETCAYAT